VIETPLTPKFDQCCGGQVTLVFEKIKKHPLHWTAKLPMYLKGVNGSDIQDHYGFVSGDLGLVTRVQDNEVLRYWTSEEALAELEKFGAIFEPLRSSSTLNIVLFGAGHVGRALVHFLLPLDVHITWVDSRDHIFPLIKSPKLKCIQTEDWQKIIRQSSSDSYFLVMTHSHQLDYQLTEAILMKNSFLYFGLIGSLKKRQRFERQLLKRLGGEISGSLKQMTCPIGLPSIKGKSPEVIAASVVAQLLSIHTRVSAEKNVTSKEVYYV
jgi:xanthine dehydrogenase accessory factor